ncbi:hypothetical protein N4T77_00070 [Clostridium sp. CX1]|uniref:hypothetical protein n=1 Tax=Clostridium sp. CX1 TaxID=2978346 RepID=UPI0021BDF280|nr:hypothetical protein [Clostridium sp. CX1]MCT8974983.1 hypothetical protein [Clostridium sp. CX1]
MKSTNNKEFIEDDLDLIVDKAIESGGSLHWIYDIKNKYKNNKSVGKGGRLLLYGMDNTIYELTKDNLLTGLMQALPYIDGNIEDIDSDSADFIIQLSLFNTVLFD